MAGKHKTIADSVYWHEMDILSGEIKGLMQSLDIQEKAIKSTKEKIKQIQMQREEFKSTWDGYRVDDRIKKTIKGEK